MDPKNLKGLLKILRANGVVHFKCNDVDITISPEYLSPLKQPIIDSDGEVVANPLDGFPDRILTNDELMYFSSGGSVDGLPENN